MKAVAKNCKVLLSVFMMLAAVIIFFLGYQRNEVECQSRRESLNAEIQSLRTQIAENNKYVDVQEELPEAMEQLEASRLALYQHFPADLLEEDQILYVLYLEELFGTEINFSFGTVDTIERFSDGAELGGLTLTVNYETTYQGFQDMIKYLSTDSRITSIQYCTLDYDEAADVATGSLTLLCYTIHSDLTPYEAPDIAKPEIGKPNIFE